MIVTSYDTDNDALYVRFAPAGAHSARTEDVSPEIRLAYDQDDRLIAIEVLNVRQRLPDASGPALASRQPAAGSAQAASPHH